MIDRDRQVEDLKHKVEYMRGAVRVQVGKTQRVVRYADVLFEGCDEEAAQQPVVTSPLESDLSNARRELGRWHRGYCDFEILFCVELGVRGNVPPHYAKELLHLLRVERDPLRTDLATSKSREVSTMSSYADQHAEEKKRADRMQSELAGAGLELDKAREEIVRSREDLAAAARRDLARANEDRNRWRDFSVEGKHIEGAELRLAIAQRDCDIAQVAIDNRDAEITRLRTAILDFAETLTKP